MYISWDASPVSNSCERRSIWSPSKRVNNPGGECRWVGEHQHAIYNGVCCFEQSCWFWWSVLHYPSPPKKKSQLSCKTNLESVLLMSSSQFCPSHLYLAQPRCFFLETPVGWSPQTWGLFVKHTKTGGDHGSIDEHSGLSYPQVISYQKDPKGSFIKIRIVLWKRWRRVLYNVQAFCVGWYIMIQLFNFVTQGTRFLFPQQLGVRQSIGGFSGRASASKSQNLCASFAVDDFCCFFQ